MEDEICARLERHAASLVAPGMRLISFGIRPLLEAVVAVVVVSLERFCGTDTRHMLLFHSYIILGIFYWKKEICRYWFCLFVFHGMIDVSSFPVLGSGILLTLGSVPLATLVWEFEGLWR